MAARGGTAPFVNRVGHAFFKTRMRDEGGILGGEVSGHYYFRDFYCADSGTIPALPILELLSVEGKRMSGCWSPTDPSTFPGRSTPRWSTSRPRWPRWPNGADGEQSTLDGISVDYDDWHFNVRPSNTEPLLRLNLESLVSRQDITWSAAATRCSR